MNETPDSSGVPSPPEPSDSPTASSPGGPPPPPAGHQAPPPPPGGGPAGAAPPPPPGPGPGSTGSSGGNPSTNTLMLVLAYLGPLALVPFLVETEDKEVQWHARNGLLLFGASVVIGLFLGVLGMVPVIGCFTVFLYIPYIFGWLILTVMCILKATQGERFVIPGLSQYVNRF